MRRRLGMSSQEFAEATRVARKTVRNIECKESSQPVAIEVIYRFARTLGVDAGDLLAEDVAA